MEFGALMGFHGILGSNVEVCEKIKMWIHVDTRWFYYMSIFYVLVKENVAWFHASTSLWSNYYKYYQFTAPNEYNFFVQSVQLSILNCL